MAWEYCTVTRFESKVWVWPAAVVDRRNLTLRIPGCVVESVAATAVDGLVTAVPLLSQGGQSANERRPEDTDCLVLTHPSWLPQQISSAIVDDLTREGWETVASRLEKPYEQVYLSKELPAA